MKVATIANPLLGIKNWVRWLMFKMLPSHKGIHHKRLLKGTYIVEHIRNGKTIGVHKGNNGVTNIGLNTILDVMFNTGSQVDPWYIGLIDGSGAQTLAAGDTMGSHAGWAELTAYSETFRQTWNP